MSYAAAIEGVLERLATVPGLVTVESGERAGDREPPPNLPLAYTLFDGFDRSVSGQIISNKYRVLIRLLVAWQGNGDEEAQIAAFVNSVPAAFDPGVKDGDGHSYATLGGRVNIAQLLSAESGDSLGFATYARHFCRIITYRLEITDKSAVGSGN